MHCDEHVCLCEHILGTIQLINQSKIFRVVQVIEITLGSTVDEKVYRSSIMSGKKRANRQAFSRWQDVDRVGAEVTVSGRLFQIDGPATGNARLPTVESLMDGTRQTIRTFGADGTVTSE